MTLTFVLGDSLHLFIKKNKLCKYSEKEVVITVRLSEFIEKKGGREKRGQERREERRGKENQKEPRLRG